MIIFDNVKYFERSNQNLEFHIGTILVILPYWYIAHIGTIALVIARFRAQYN